MLCVTEKSGKEVMSKGSSGMEVILASMEVSSLIQKLEVSSLIKEIDSTIS